MRTDELQVMPRREAAMGRADLEARRSFVTDCLLLVAVALGVVAFINTILRATQEPHRWLLAVPLLGGCGLLLALVLLRRRISYRVRAWGFLLMGYLVAALFLAGLGSQGSGVLLLVVLPALALVLLGPYSGFAATMLSILVYAGVAGAMGTGILAGDSLLRLSSLDLTSWLPLGLAASFVLVALLLLAQVMRMQAPAPEGEAAGEMLLVGHTPAVAPMAEHSPPVRQETASAEDGGSSAEARDPDPGMVADDPPPARRGPRPAARDEGRYARLLEAAAGISRQVLQVRRREDLLQEMVDLLVERLGFQRVAVYVVEGRGPRPEPALPPAQQPEPPLLRLVPGPVAGHHSAGLWAEDAGASSAEVPAPVARMVEGVTSAQSAPGGAEVISGGEDPPEILLPLRAAGTLLAVLHVVGLPWEATLEAAVWREEEVAALEILADQLAVALENAQVLEEAEARLQELDALQRHYTTEAWGRFIEGRGRTAHRWFSPASEAAEPGGGPAAAAPSAEGLAEDVWRSLFERVRAEGRPVSALRRESGQYVLAMPVRLREALIGVLGFRRPQQAGSWQEAEIAAIEGVASRMAFAAENLRLLEEAQRRAAREQALSQMTAHFARSFNMDTVLRAAVRELGQLPDVAEVSVYVGESDLPAPPRGDAES
jgi:GAF domain-containing protein